MPRDTIVKQVDNCRCKELLSLLRKMTQSIEQHSKHLNKHIGMTGPQLVILQELAQGEMTVTELARKVSLSQGTVTDIIHRLEKKSLILKRRASLDKRCVLITLSEMCRLKLERAPVPLQEKFTSAFLGLDEWEQLMILSVMNRVVDLMVADSEGQEAASRVSWNVKDCLTTTPENSMDSGPIRS